MNKPMDIIEMFESINGEGDELGRRTLFIRVFGCSANCPGCDTSYAKGNREKADIKEMLAQEVVTYAKKHNLNHITITGGEPFEQKYINEWIDFFLRAAITVTIETNGMRRPREIPDRLHVVVSPKPWMLVDKNRDAYYYWNKMGATFKFAGAPDDVERIRKWYKILRLQKAYIQPWIDPEKADYENMKKAYLDLLKVVHEKFNQGEDIRVVPQWHKYLWGNERGI